MHVTNNQFADKFNKGWKKFKLADLFSFFAFYVNNLTLWPGIDIAVYGDMHYDEPFEVIR